MWSIHGRTSVWHKGDIMDEYYKITYTVGKDANKVRSIIASGNNEDIATAKVLRALTGCTPSILSIELIANPGRAAKPPALRPNLKAAVAGFASQRQFAA
jgi:hypothetical protein